MPVFGRLCFLKKPQARSRETQLRNCPFIINFMVVATELGSQGNMKQDINVICCRLLYELIGDLLENVQKYFAPFCRLLVYAWLIGGRTLWREQYSTVDTSMDSGSSSRFKSSLLLTSWINLVMSFNFSVTVPPPVYNEDGDNKAYLKCVDVKLKTANKRKAFTIVPIPK